MDPFRSLRTTAVPEGSFVGEGHKVVRRMLKWAEVTHLLMTHEWHDRLAAEIPPEADLRLRSKEAMQEIVGFRIHQGIMAMGRIPSAPPKIARGLLLALDNVADAENVGAIMRSCAAFGVDGVLVGPTTCSPWIRRAVRVSLGAPMKVPVHPCNDLAATLRTLDMPRYAAHIHGDRVDIGKLDLTPPCCLVLGGEANGVSDEVIAACDKTLYIPMAGDWDCLNVAASAAVLLFAARQR